PAERTHDRCVVISDSMASEEKTVTAHPSPVPEEFVVVTDTSAPQTPAPLKSGPPLRREAGYAYLDTPGPAMPGGIAGPLRVASVHAVGQDAGQTSEQYSFGPIQAPESTAGQRLPLDVNRHSAHESPSGVRPAHSTPFRGIMPQATTPATVREASLEVKLEPISGSVNQYVGPVDIEDDSSDEEEDNRTHSTLEVQVQITFDKYPGISKESTRKRLGLYVLSHFQHMERRNQVIPPTFSSDYMDLYLRILELEIQEYLKRKLMRGSAASTPSNAELYPANHLEKSLLPTIEEAVEYFHAPQHPGESVEEYRRRRAAAQRQQTTTGVVTQALSVVETVTTTPASEVPQPRAHNGRTSNHRVKEEPTEEIVSPNVQDPGRRQRDNGVPRRVRVADTFQDRVSYQRIRNEDLRNIGYSNIDDQGVAFEGRNGVTPVDTISQRMHVRSGNPDRDPGGPDSDGDDNDDGRNRRNPDHGPRQQTRQ
ncbi:hypothetical protein H0H93_007147, partial [Arthromyces matolae]